MYRISSLLFLALLSASSVHAQTTANGSVRGVVADEQGAVLPGVSIVATSETVPGIHAATTHSDGSYRLLDLPPGDYVIVATLPSFESPESRVTVRAGGNRDLNIVMTIGSIDETVEVTQETPLLETQNAGQSVQISGRLLRSMPLSERREWFGALTLAPGVTTAEWANNEKFFYVHGAAANTNVIQIDGADVAPALLSGVGYIGLNTDLIDDIQVKTAGVDASSPLGVGGVINIATASGTNELRGTTSAFLQPRAWNASNTPGGTSSTVDQRHVDLSLGGPVVRDRLWAFGAYRYVDVENGISRTSTELEALRALVPGFAPFDGTNEAHFWFTKLNGQLSNAHRLEGFYQRDVNPVTSATAVVEHPTTEAAGGNGASVRLSSIWSDRLTTRFGASYNDKRNDDRDPGIDEPLRRVFQDTIPSGGRLVGNGRLANLDSPVTAWNEQPNSKLTLSFDATLFASHLLGSHELQVGAYAQPRIEVGLRTFYVNDGFVFEEAVLREPSVLDGTVQPFHRQIVDGTELTNSRREGEDLAVYVQDAWRPIVNLTINAGIRIDRIAWTDRLFDVTTQRTTEIGPRLGVNYALTRNGRNVVRAHWVRVHDHPSQTRISAGTSALGRRDLYDLDLDGTFETVYETPATLAVRPDRTIDRNLHQPFIHEWGTGYETQLGGNVTARVDVVRRRFRDRLTFVETNAQYRDNSFVGYEDEAFNELYLATNNQWNSPVYSSFEVALTKRTARLEGIASYVRQWRHIAGTWQPNDPAAFIQPQAFANDKGIGSPTGSTGTPSTDANSLSDGHMSQRGTGSAQWQNHIVRVGVTYTGPWQLLLASTYAFQSGAWSGPIISSLDSPDPAFGPETVTLSNGRVVANPLATTLRFAFPTRGEGQLRTPTLHTWNVRIGRRFLWRALTLDAGLDVFNVTNNGADLSFESGATETFNPLFGSTTFRQLPRSAQLVLRLSY
ncbi:MAG: hypothetical protein GEV06_06725 [Luteitalea sp.]|nr:hypothetical protein [Luteitalea sp.]